MKKILFIGKNLRVRRRETIMNPPDGIKFIPLQSLESMKKDYDLSNPKIKENIYIKFINFISDIYINKKKLKNINLIYSPGKIIFNKFPYVIEIDNIVVLSYYNLFLLNFFKLFIKKKLESNYCKQILCLSYAAKNALENYFQSKKINNKISVIYPYVKLQKQNKILSKKKINILFISTHFYLKGGRELINAFSKFNSERFQLTIITKKKDLKDPELNIINKNKNIILKEANLKKKILFKDYYSKTDLFILPTYQDSFGMVLLEALSFGIPIISTNLYNIPEIVVNNYNGFLIKPPFYYFHKKTNLPNEKVWKLNLIEFTKKNYFKSVEIQLYDRLKIIEKNPQILRDMSNNAMVHFKENFSNNIRLKKLQVVLNI